MTASRPFRSGLGNDAELLLLELRRLGYAVEHARVETADGMLCA